MGTTKLNIGKIPISKGEYQEGTAYQRLNQVTMLGSTYQSKIDGNTSAPAQMGADGAVENINTDKWLCIAAGNVSAARKVVYNNETSGLEAGNVQEAIDETNTKVSDLANSIVGFSKSFTFNKVDSYIVSLSDVKFKKGQYACIMVKTTPAISTVYNGNATNMTNQYPSLKIDDGFGVVVVGPATTDDAALSTFGYGEAGFVTSEHTAEFTIFPMESADELPLKILIQKNTDGIQKNTEGIQKNSEGIQKNTIGWQEENIPSLLETPFEHNFRVPGYTAIIRSWGFIGDSLCSGEMECFEGETRKFVDMYEYSWGQQICRLCGSEGYNYSNGGQTAQGWIYSQERGWGKAKTTPHQAYIIALGVNDASQTTKGNIETDVDFSNYENNANTFAGNYCGIIQRIRSISKRSIIFVVSDPKNNELNEIIKATPSKFKNVFLIDLTSLIPLYSNAEFNKKYKMNGHLNAAGYLFTAYMFMHYIDYIIQKNPDVFTDIALWNTNYTSIATSDN